MAAGTSIGDVQSASGETFAHDHSFLYLVVAAALENQGTRKCRCYDVMGLRGERVSSRSLCVYRAFGVHVHRQETLFKYVWHLCLELIKVVHGNLTSGTIVACKIVVGHDLLRHQDVQSLVADNSDGLETALISAVESRCVIPLTAIKLYGITRNMSGVVQVYVAFPASRGNKLILSSAEFWQVCVALFIFARAEQTKLNVCRR